MKIVRLAMILIMGSAIGTATTQAGPLKKSAAPKNQKKAAAKKTVSKPVVKKQMAAKKITKKAIKQKVTVLSFQSGPSHKKPEPVVSAKNLKLGKAPVRTPATARTVAKKPTPKVAKVADKKIAQKNRRPATVIPLSGNAAIKKLPAQKIGRRPATAVKQRKSAQQERSTAFATTVAAQDDFPTAARLPEYKKLCMVNHSGTKVCSSYTFGR